MKFLRGGFLLFLALFTICQFVPLQTVQTASAKRQAIPVDQIRNKQVEMLLHRSCEDCHSSHAALPWYGHIAPVSWMLTSHVNRGVKKWDIAAWEQRKPLQGEKEDMCDAVSDHSMPLPSYTMIHRSARLTPAEIETLCTWATGKQPVSTNPEEASSK